MQAGEQLVRVNQDTRLNFRVLDVRTPANQGIFRIQSQVGNVKHIIFDAILMSLIIYFLITLAPVGVASNLSLLK